jgi:hypothetical protein
MRRIARAWRTIEVESAKRRIRPAAIAALEPEELNRCKRDWEGLGLRVHVVASTRKAVGYSTAIQKPLPGDKVSLRVAVGTTTSVRHLAESYERGDVVAVGAALGYPACCCGFFHTTYVRAKWHDTTWPMAIAGLESPTVRETAVDCTGPPQTNILWRWLGIRATPHLPCRNSCEASVDLAQRLIRLGRDLGFDDEMSDLLAVLSWPVEWSALHGIAEIRTPILKVATRTDATGEALRVRRFGTEYPVEGAFGTQFPYNLKHRGATVLSTQAATPTALGATSPVLLNEEARRNGFASAAAMRAAHAPLVAAVRARLAPSEGSILDLGCGTAALLREITASGSLGIPWGIDRNAHAIAIAKQTLPQFASNFSVGDFWDQSAIWQRRYRVGLLALRRLSEVEQPRGEALLANLRNHVEELLLYVYIDRSGDNQSFNLAVRFNLTHEPIERTDPRVHWAWALRH